MGKTRKTYDVKFKKKVVEFQEFAGEGHVTVLPALISRALRFVSRNSV
ncbi:putative alpha/beta superfamily hydrolase [Geobacillus thermodenitrificans]|jgi:predicted alpha/beta superfamily hydrolase|nr:putative alpha/beta superfamily hydrolase [Geobacillus thermodenitrificans]